MKPQRKAWSYFSVNKLYELLNLVCCERNPPMRTLLVTFSLIVAVLMIGCSKEAQPVQIAGWERYQEPYFKAHFAHPKGWHMLSEGNKISYYSTPEAVDKFYDPTSKGKIGIQLMVSYEKMEAPKSLEDVVASWKSDMENSGFTIASTEAVIIDSTPGTKIHYRGVFDEQTTLEAIRAMTVKDTVLYIIHYGAFNELFAPNTFLFDSLLASVKLYRPKPAGEVVDVKPSSSFVEFSNNVLSISYPDNFEPTFPTPKGEVQFSLELRGYRADCSIHIDVLPAKGLTVEKVVEQNQKYYKSKSRGTTTFDGTNVIYLNYSPTRNIDSRVYFMVKNDRVYRMIFNIYQPMKNDYLPAFEKTIASVRVK